MAFGYGRDYSVYPYPRDASYGYGNRLLSFQVRVFLEPFHPAVDARGRGYQGLSARIALVDDRSGGEIFEQRRPFESLRAAQRQLERVGDLRAERCPTLVDGEGKRGFELVGAVLSGLERALLGHRSN